MLKRRTIRGFKFFIGEVLNSDFIAQEAEISNIYVVESEEALKMISFSDTKDLLIICPILRISEEDIRTRDIKSERESAYKRMKQKGSRKSFDWYYGSKAKVIYYLLPIILIPLAALIGYFVSLTMTEYYKELSELWFEAGNSAPNYLFQYYNIIYPIIAGCGCALIFMIIEVIRRFRQYLKWWYIMLAISFFSVLFVIACVATIPFYIYCCYQVFVLKGKNRK